MQLRILGLLLGLLSLVSALSAVGNKLLVVIDDEGDKGKYGQFWMDLEERGFQLTYRTPKDTSLSLFLHGEPAYSHLLLLPSKSKGLGPALTPNLLVDFVNQGSNILLALSSEQGVSSAVSSLLLELDISLSPDRNSVVVDHFNHDSKSASEKHDVLVLSSPNPNNKAIKNFFSVDGLLALPHAVGQVLGNTSPLLSPILKAPETAYIYNPKEEADTADEPFATGAQINLVTAFQARNSARVAVLGSAEALEDKWFTSTIQSPTSKSSTGTANRAFAQRLSAWTFHESGVLRTGSIRHHLSDPVEEGSTAEKMSIAGASYRDDEGNPSIYRIKNNIHYSIALSEWNGEHWEPFTPASADDVQLEVSMLSPFHRLNLTPSPASSNTDKNATVFTADFKLPDQHGIFNLLVEYRRPFLSNLEAKRTVTVRHFAHDEWPRSYAISAAWPWISGIWVTILGWVAFVAVWLYSKPAEVRGGKVAGAKR